jgi:hypothetical protein
LSKITAPHSDTLPLALSALTGVLSAAASGAGIFLTGGDGIPQLAAAAVPGVLAFLVSCLMAQNMTADSGVPLLPAPETHA